MMHVTLEIYYLLSKFFSHILYLFNLSGSNLHVEAITLIHVVNHIKYYMYSLIKSFTTISIERKFSKNKNDKINM